MKSKSQNVAAPEANRGGKSHRVFMVCVILTFVTLAVFWQVKDHEFINMDDNLYVTESMQVQSGISIENLKWALITGHASNWHPMTWVSHMLDVQLFGLKAGWHHLMNVFFHIVNALLLFLILHRMTKALWQSAFVAALFALHPLHVESVAWIAERKDVLSTLFWLLTLGAYAYYVKRPGYRRYLPVLGFFALGLMSKPMLVTLPFVLLLLDYWPLGRFPAMQNLSGSRNAACPEDPAEKKPKPAKASRKKTTPLTKLTAHPGQWPVIRLLLLEKVPLFIFSIISSVLTVLNQEEAMRTLQEFPVADRIANALVSYVKYLGMMLWPWDLAVFYPHPIAYPLWQVLGAGLLLLAATFLAVKNIKRFPYVIVGWLWYLGTLVPVIGLVQVGLQAMADRYSYVPLIGIFIITAWGLPDCFHKWHYRKTALGLLSGAAILACVAITWVQLQFWRDSATLLRHTLEVTSNNFIANNNLGTVLSARGESEAAITHFRTALDINPKYATAWYNLGNAYGKSGQVDKAVEAYQQALLINPEYAEVWNNLGLAYGESGQTAKAIEAFQKLLRLNPEYAESWFSLGNAYGKSGQTDRAIEAYQRALSINPKHAEAWNNLGRVLGKSGQTAKAIEAFRQALHINPKHSGAWNNLGIAYRQSGETAKAIEAYQQALRINPGSAQAWFNLGILYLESGQKEQVAEVYRRLKTIDPNAAEEFSRILPRQ